MCQHCDEINRRLITAEMAGNQRSAEVQRRLLRQCRENFHPRRTGAIVLKFDELRKKGMFK